MGAFSLPALVYCEGKRFLLTPEQWRRLSPQLKGLTAKERGPVGRTFLVEEGILKEDVGA